MDGQNVNNNKVYTTTPAMVHWHKVQYEQCVTSVSTHCFANKSVVFLHLIVTTLTLLLLLGRGFPLSVVSFGIAVDVQDVCRTQRPLKLLVCGAAAVAQLRLLTATLLGAQSHHLALSGLRRMDVCSQQAVLVFFWGASSVWRFLSASSALRFSLWLGVFVLLRL